MAQEEIREKIKILLIGGKHTLTEISRILEVDRGTVYRVKKRFLMNNQELADRIYSAIRLNIPLLS